MTTTRKGGTVRSAPLSAGAQEGRPSTIGGHDDRERRGNDENRYVDDSGAVNSLSSSQRTVTFPAAGSFAFDYFVDSEQSFDFLKVYVDGTLSGSWSGSARAGRFKIPVAAGAHTLQFAYSKDSSVDRGLDLALVDNVVALDAQGELFRDGFNGRSAVSAGWTGAGVSGGFAKTVLPRPRVFRRPVSQAFKGVQSATSSGSERVITWAGTAPYQLAFDYVVDSEVGYDFLRVFVDGVEKWTASGQKAGTAVLTMPSSGPHTVSFRYTKDTSVDVGRDIAIVDDVQATSGGELFESSCFDGYAFDAQPYGWAATTGGSAWTVGAAVPPAVNVKRTTGSAPTIDGTLSYNSSTSEYTTPTRLPALDAVDKLGRVGTLLLQEIESDQTLVVSGRLHSSTLQGGSESGAITVYFDANRSYSLDGRGCGPGASLPSQEDRKIVFTYNSSSGTWSQPSVTVAQSLGTCAGWLALPSGSSSEWATTVAIKEPEGDPGYLHFEARIQLYPRSGGPSSVLAEGQVGFAVAHQRTAASGFDCYPLRQGGCPLETDVSSWSTIEFGTYHTAGSKVEASPWLVTPTFY